MTQNNSVQCRLHSPAHKKILTAAANEHYSGTMSGFLKVWMVIVCRLISAGITPELILAHLDEVVKVLEDKQVE